MNRERVKIAIKILKRNKAIGHPFNMERWQMVDGNASTTEEQLHKCGTAACFAGLVAVSPEFQAEKGSADVDLGYPIFQDHFGVSAIEKWLDIRQTIAEHLCGFEFANSFEPNTSLTENDIIQRLEYLLKMGEEMYTIEYGL